MPGLTHSIACYFLSTRGDYPFLLFQESVMAKAKLALLTDSEYFSSSYTWQMSERLDGRTTRASLLGNA